MNNTPETDLFKTAISHWWEAKWEAERVNAEKARLKAEAEARGEKAPKFKSQGGTRDASLGGKTMDGFAAAISDFLIGLNVKPEHIFSGGHLTKTPSILPSYFRPSKNWDLIVLGGSRFHSAPCDTGTPVLYAATEFKSQDKSIGNNQNNRLEESLGNALDFWTTYERSGFERQQPRPWLGYLFVGKYDPASDGKSVRIEQPHFLAAPPFRTEGSDELRKFAGPSYAERYKIFMKQSVGARLYDAGAFIVTDESIAAKTVNHRIPLPEFGSANFLRSLKAQILAHYPGAKIKPESLAAKI